MAIRGVEGGLLKQTGMFVALLIGVRILDFLLFLGCSDQGKMPILLRHNKTIFIADSIQNVYTFFK